MWRQWSWSTYDQVMACCLTAPSHHLSQCWLIIACVLCLSPEGNFTGDAQDNYHRYECENYSFMMTATFLGGHCLSNMDLQSSAVITWSYIACYCTHQCRSWGWTTKNPPHTSPWRARYGVSFVNILEKNWPRYNGTALYWFLPTWHIAWAAVCGSSVEGSLRTCWPGGVGSHGHRGPGQRTGLASPLEDDCTAR